MTHPQKSLPHPAARPPQNGDAGRFEGPRHPQLHSASATADKLPSDRFGDRHHGKWRPATGPWESRFAGRHGELAFGHPRHSLARQAADDFAAIAAINRANVFDRLTAEQIGRSRKAKNRRFGPNAEQLGFRGGGDAAFRDFIRKVDLDSVAFPERLVEGAGGLESAGKLGAEARGQVGGFNAERNGVGEADALETIDFVPIGEAEGFRHFARRADAREFEHLGARASAACAHFLAEGEHLAGIFFELSVRDERAFSALAIDDAHFAEGLEGLAGRHAADAKAGSDFLFGGQGVTGVQSAGANLLEQLLADLVVERQNALPVERQHFQNDVPPVCQARAECRSAETNGTGGETAEFSHCRNPKNRRKKRKAACIDNWTYIPVRRQMSSSLSGGGPVRARMLATGGSEGMRSISASEARQRECSAEGPGGMAGPGAVWGAGRKRRRSPRLKAGGSLAGKDSMEASSTRSRKSLRIAQAWPGAAGVFR